MERKLIVTKNLDVVIHVVIKAIVCGHTMSLVCEDAKTADALEKHTPSYCPACQIKQIGRGF